LIRTLCLNKNALNFDKLQFRQARTNFDIFGGKRHQHTFKTDVSIQVYFPFVFTYFIMPRPVGIKRWCASDVCRVQREQRGPGRLKLAQR